MTLKNMKKTYYCIALICISLYGNLKAQDKLAQTGLQFLEIGVSPRAEAMGGAFVVTGNNSDAIFYNQAGLSNINTKIDATFSRVQWFADIAYNALGITYKPSNGNYGVIGLSFQSADYGDFYGTRVAAGTAAGYEDTGIFSPTTFIFGLSYAKQLNDRFSIGGQVKYVTQNLGSNVLTFGGPIEENNVSGLVFDFGMIYSTSFKGFDFGMSIKNFSTDFKFEEFAFEAPLTFRMGVLLNVMEILKINPTGQNILLSVDAIHPRDFGEHLNIGLEYKLYDFVSFRGGYKFNYSEESFTAGIGLEQKISELDLRIDYSYGAFGIWSNVQRFSIGFSF